MTHRVFISSRKKRVYIIRQCFEMMNCPFITLANENERPPTAGPSSLREDWTGFGLHRRYRNIIHLHSLGRLNRKCIGAVVDLLGRLHSFTFPTAL
ncbi:hypothetical protein EVAR_62743_1 [Eumeta japonica]|uniref:Uncharacterized protein n=1 Tax=Eumeta variegata TaxID=151549 RepID=A0A4C1ZCW1_EUMVA|nr:hypothetical protein EVAR_62743_1 [Eumeta japonica]